MSVNNFNVSALTDGGRKGKPYTYLRGTAWCLGALGTVIRAIGSRNKQFYAFSKNKTRGRLSHSR